MGTWVHPFTFDDRCGECLAPMAMHTASYQPDHVPEWVGADEDACACGAPRYIADDPTTDPLEHGQRPDHPFYMLCSECGMADDEHEDEDEPEDEDEDGAELVTDPAHEADRLAAFAEYLEPHPDRTWVVTEAAPKPRP